MCSALADKDRKEKNYERRKALQGEKNITAWMESWIGVRKFETS